MDDMQRATQIMLKMRAAVPPGRQLLTDADYACLAHLTRELLECRPAAATEYARFRSARRKDIELPPAAIAARVRGKRILVTGGTGCIGSALLSRLARFQPARLVSVSRGVTRGWPRLARAEYFWADIRDPGQLAAVFGQDRFDIVFHVAGQRDPGRAERMVHETVTTNALGTRNLLRASTAAGVGQVVLASTGKALRPYAAEVYTASKRIAEWQMCEAAASGEMQCSAVRFTHVIDNSIVHRRLLDWCAGGLIRLHDPDAAFYVQSALQSANLLLAAAGDPERGSLPVYAINDLGLPAMLLEVALGALARTGSATPIYFSGYEYGYEALPFPGLYDPLTAGDISPLISAFEASSARPSWCPAADVFPLRLGPGPDRQVQALVARCAQTGEPAAIRSALDDCSWGLFDAAMAATPRQVLRRTVKLSLPHQSSLTPDHQRMLATISRYADPGSPEPEVQPRPAARAAGLSVLRPQPARLSAADAR
jgi:nucleoside-diphosphate-sugar epimerase